MVLLHSCHAGGRHRKHNTRRSYCLLPCHMKWTNNKHASKGSCCNHATKRPNRQHATRRSENEHATQGALTASMPRSGLTAPMPQSGPTCDMPCARQSNCQQATQGRPCNKHTTKRLLRSCHKGVSQRTRRSYCQLATRGGLTAAMPQSDLTAALSHSCPTDNVPPRGPTPSGLTLPACDTGRTVQQPCHKMVLPCHKAVLRMKCRKAVLPAASHAKWTYNEHAAKRSYSSHATQLSYRKHAARQSYWQLATQGVTRTAQSCLTAVMPRS